MRTVIRLRRDDEIDTLVDGLLADPSRADELKAELRRRFRVVVASPPTADAHDLHDFWDNVPV